MLPYFHMSIVHIRLTMLGAATDFPIIPKDRGEEGKGFHPRLLRILSSRSSTKLPGVPCECVLTACSNS